MKLEELKQLNKQPLSDNTKAETLTKSLHMTNYDFQQQLKLMKLLNQETIARRINSPTTPYVVGKHYFTLSNENEETGNTYYIKFINDVLKNIRKGEIEYCYYIGQVRELLRFIPDLKVRLGDFYFEVWN